MEEDYVVRRGDSLSKIAAIHGMSLDRLLELNPGIENRNLINIGQRLQLSEASPISLLDMLPSAPSMGGSGSSYDVALAALKELAGNANQSIYDASQNIQSKVSGAIDSGWGSFGNFLRDVRETINENKQNISGLATTTAAAALPHAIRYTYLPDNAIVDNQFNYDIYNAFAKLMASEYGPKLLEEGIQDYSMYQDLGGAADIAGGDGQITNPDIDAFSKTFGSVAPGNIKVNEDGSITLEDRYNFDFTENFLWDQIGERWRKGNETGSGLAALEYLFTKARNLMASVRPDMYDYEMGGDDRTYTVDGVQKTGVYTHPEERNRTGYITRITITPEDIERARQGLPIAPRSDPGTLTIAGTTGRSFPEVLLKRISSELGKPVEGGMRGF